MRKFKLYGNSKDPFINAEDGKMEIIGRMFEYTDHLKLLYAWLEEYSQSPLEYTYLTINSDYISSTPKRTLLIILSRLNKLKTDGYKVYVKWVHEKDDDDMIELADEYKSMFNQINFDIGYDKNFLREKKLRRILLDDNEE